MTVNPEDVHWGNIVMGEIHVRSWGDEMPTPGSRVRFADRDWLVTRTHVRMPGGRACYVAILLTGGAE